jgi:hypothetical protein
MPDHFRCMHRHGRVVQHVTDSRHDDLLRAHLRLRQGVQSMNLNFGQKGFALKFSYNSGKNFIQTVFPAMIDRTL